MGFLDKWFGQKESEGDKWRKVEQKQQEELNARMKMPARPFGEMELADRVSEADETPRTVEFFQHKHGKLLRSPGGPILEGYEHGYTGSSSDIPFQPSRNFPGRDDHTPPFNGTEEGEYVKRIEEKDGKQYIVCASSAKPSEAGKGKQGRLYTEVHTLLVPAQEWSVAVIPQLGDTLHPEGLVGKLNFAMDTVRLNTDILDQPLPPDWFNPYIQDLIAATVAGKPFAVVDLEISGKEFLRRLYLGLLCIPENAAREISFGAAMHHATPGNVRIAHAEHESYTVKKNKDGWKGRSVEDIAFGQRYITALIQVLGDCKTPREVMKAVQHLPTALKEEVTRRIREKLVLEDWQIRSQRSCSL